MERFIRGRYGGDTEEISCVRTDADARLISLVTCTEPVDRRRRLEESLTVTLTAEARTPAALAKTTAMESYTRAEGERERARCVPVRCSEIARETMQRDSAR